MIPVSNDYKRELIRGNRNYLIKVDVTLADSTVLHLTNEHIWDNGITIDEAISSDDSFDIGAAIVSSLTVVINNINEDFSTYDFYDAHLVLYLGVEGDVDSSDVQRYYRKGFYVVDEPSYNGSLITLSCLDNMTWFDVPFSDVNFSTASNTTTGQLVTAICSHVGVTLGTPSFPYYDQTITVAMLEEISKNQINCREVIQYVAQRCCCYCKINTAGELVLKWHNKQEIIGITDYDGGTYNTTTTPYSDGCELDGGHFMYGGDSADGGTFADLMNAVYLSQHFEINVSTDDIVVTGCRVRNNTSNENAYDELWVDSTLELTHARYVLIIENNPFISKATAATIAATIGNILAGLPIRGFASTSLSDFSVETGDMATVVDFRGNRYYTWVTHFTFTTNNSETFSCGVQSLRKRSEERFSGTVKTLAEANANAENMLSEYDLAVKAMDTLAQNAIGYNEYVQNVGGAKIMYRYNGSSHTTSVPPKFQGSTVVFKISGDGVFVAKGSDIAADGTCTFSNGYDANSGTAILNLIYAIGINCDWIKAGTLTLGGNNNVNGSLRILNSSGAQIGKWDKDGISATTGTFSGALSGATGTFAGALSAATGTFKGALQAATGTITDGTGTLSMSGGDLHISNANSGGAGLFAVRADTYYYSCWGAVNSAAQDSNSAGGYIDCPTKNVIRAGIDASDRRLKKNIKDINPDFAKSLIMGIQPKTFYYKANKNLPSELQFGVIAQDVLAVEEEYGITEKNRLCYVQDDGMLAVNYKQLIAPMIKVIQEQQGQIDELKQELADLKARVK